MGLTYFGTTLENEMKHRRVSIPELGTPRRRVRSALGARGRRFVQRFLARGGGTVLPSRKFRFMIRPIYRCVRVAVDPDNARGFPPRFHMVRPGMVSAAAILLGVSPLPEMLL